jgi:hypothetical protein
MTGKQVYDAVCRGLKANRQRDDFYPTRQESWRYFTPSPPQWAWLSPSEQAAFARAAVILGEKA